MYQNLNKNMLRTRLSNKCLEDLMRISEDCPALKQFNFEKALLKRKYIFQGRVKKNVMYITHCKL